MIKGMKIGFAGAGAVFIVLGDPMGAASCLVMARCLEMKGH